MALDSTELRKAILYNSMNCEEYAQKTLPYLTEEYFVDRHEKILFNEISDFFTKYSSSPGIEPIKIQVNARDDLSESVYVELENFLSKDVTPIANVDFLVTKTENWCQERAIVNAVYKAVNIIGGEDKKTSMTALPDLLRDAIGTSFDDSVGHDFFEDADQRWDFYNTNEEKLSTGVEHFDFLLSGGLPKKTLGVFLASTGVGKSLFMTAISTNVLAAGKNVLYITMEMSEEKISERVDQNLLDLTQEELHLISKDNFKSKILEMRRRTAGTLVVKEYPTKTAHSGHFRALLRELENKKGFKPDLVCIDYLNICASASAPKGSNSYTEAKAVAEELRSIAMEFEVPLITATQTNRSGAGDADPDITSVSESFGVPMTADWFFALSSNETLKSEGLVRVTQLKNRYNDVNDRRNWLLGVDYAKMRIEDLDNQPDSINAQNADLKPKQQSIMDVAGDGFKWN